MEMGVEKGDPTNQHSLPLHLAKPCSDEVRKRTTDSTGTRLSGLEDLHWI